MKRIFAFITTAAFVLLLFNNAFAAPGDTERRTITVTGSAEMDIIPDDVTITIVLSESSTDRKFISGERENILKEEEEEMFKQLDELGIDRGEVLLKSKHRSRGLKAKYFNARNIYELKTDDPDLVVILFNNLNSGSVSDIYISEKSHSKIDEYRKQVKVEALKAAMQKAEYMLESIGSKTGQVLSIKELDPNPRNMWQNQDPYSNIKLPRPDRETNENMYRINLRYEVETVFEIK